MGLGKLWTALRGASNEAVEAIEDTQAIRILDQELREAHKELEQSNISLTTIAAKRKLAENKLGSLNSEITKYTEHAISASNSGEDELAIECANKVAELEVEATTENSIFEQYQANEASLKTNIKKAKNSLRTLTQQIDQVKANAQVQKAHAAATARTTGANSKMNTALSSLDRIKAKQQEAQARIEVAEEMAADESGQSIEAKLKSAGIVSGGQTAGKDKLAELLAKKSS